MEESAKPLLGLEADRLLNKLKSEKKPKVADAERRSEASTTKFDRRSSATTAKFVADGDAPSDASTAKLASGEAANYVGILGKYVESKSDAIKDYTVDQLKQFLQDIERDGWIKNNMLSYVVDNKLIKK